MEVLGHAVVCHDRETAAGLRECSASASFFFLRAVPDLVPVSYSWGGFVANSITRLTQVAIVSGLMITAATGARAVPSRMMATPANILCWSAINSAPDKMQGKHSAQSRSVISYCTA